MAITATCALLAIYGLYFIAGINCVSSASTTTTTTASTTATEMNTTASKEENLFTSPMFIGLTVGFGSFAAFSLICCLIFNYGGCFKDGRVSPLMSDDKVRPISIQQE